MKRFFLLLATLALLAAPGCGPVRTLRQAQQADRQARQASQTNRQPAPGEPEEIVTHETVTLTYSFRDCDIMNPGARLFLEQVDYSDAPGFKDAKTSAAGADRTGTLAFLLIEALLGVGDSDLSKDFEITSFDRFDWRTRIPRDDDPTHTIGLLIPYLRSGQFGEPSRPLRELVYNWATSETQDDLGSEYVAPLTAEEIARLRSHLLVLE